MRRTLRRFAIERRSRWENREREDSLLRTKKPLRITLETGYIKCHICAAIISKDSLCQMANAILRLRPLRLDAVAVDQESSNDFFLRDGETFKCVACP